MKILYIIDTLKGYGAEKSIVHLAQGLRKFTPIVIHIYKGDDLKDKLIEKKIQVHSLNLSAKSGFQRAVDLITPIILKENPIIIHSTLFRSDMVARKIKKKFPKLILIGSIVSNSYGKNRYGQLSYIDRLKLFSTQIRDRKSAKFVDFFISNSNAIKTSNIKALGIPEEKVSVIYRGRKIENVSMIPQEIISFKRNLMVKDEIIFLNVGRLNKSKGQKDLIFAFKNVVEFRSDVLLFIAGEGSLQNELEILIAELELQEKVFLLGYRDDISQLLLIADFFIFPSYYEGLPGALIEAILSRTPCIASGIPENRECFPGRGALFFEPGSIEQLSSCMLQALSMDNWAEITSKSFHIASKKFEIEKVIKRYENLLFSILRDTQEQNWN